MKIGRFPRACAAGLLVAAIAVTAAAPAAEAKHDKGRRYKHSKHKEYACAPVTRHARVVEVRRGTGPGPVLAGLIGGIALGATLARAEPAYCEEPVVRYRPRPARHVYAYYDPYCGERFASLEIYASHFRHHRHPRIVHVIEVRTGRCVDTYRYHRGGWTDWDDDWEDDWDDY